MNAIANGFTHLMDFNGREARKPFWIYVVFLYVIQMLVSVGIMAPAMIAFFKSVINAAKLAGPESGDAAFSAAMQGAATDFVTQISELAWIGIVTNILFWLLVAAITVRRLHDSDMSGWWVVLPIALSLVPLPFQDEIMAETMANMTAQMQPGASPFAAQSPLVMVISLLGYAVIGLMLWYGIRKGSEGDNRFGPSPVSAGR